MIWQDYPFCTMAELDAEVSELDTIVMFSRDSSKYADKIADKHAKAKSDLRKLILTRVTDSYAVRNSPGKAWLLPFIESGYTLDYLLRDDFILNAINNPQELRDYVAARILELLFVDKLSQNATIKELSNVKESRIYWSEQAEKRWNVDRELITVNLDGSGNTTDFERLRTRDYFVRT